MRPYLRSESASGLSLLTFTYSSMKEASERSLNLFASFHHKVFLCHEFKNSYSFISPKYLAKKVFGKRLQNVTDMADISV